MNRANFGVLLLAVAVGSTALACRNATGLRGEPAARSAASSAPADLRVAVYDPRAVAVAFAPSRHNTVVEDLKRQRDAAKARGDAKEVREIEAQGAAFQERLHEQGFYGAPVDDLLAYVEPCVADILKSHGAETLESRWEVSPEVASAAPDVTSELVNCFDPSEKTLKWIEDLRNSEPLKH